MERQVKLYALSTCAWCRKTKKFLADRSIPHEIEDVDLLTGDVKAQARAEVAKHNPRLSYPTLVIDGGTTVIVGYDEEKMQEVFGNGTREVESAP
jgi:glutaredoxin-like protein NrdH